MRKVVQIAAANEATGIAVIAVADDGTVWAGCFEGDAHEGNNWQWREVPGLPTRPTAFTEAP